MCRGRQRQLSQLDEAAWARAATVALAVATAWLKPPPGRKHWRLADFTPYDVPRPAVPAGRRRLTKDTMHDLKLMLGFGP